MIAPLPGFTKARNRRPFAEGDRVINIVQVAGGATICTAGQVVMVDAERGLLLEAEGVGRWFADPNLCEHRGAVRAFRICGAWSRYCIEEVAHDLGARGRWSMFLVRDAEQLDEAGLMEVVGMYSELEEAEARVEELSAKALAAAGE